MYIWINKTYELIKQYMTAITDDHFLREQIIEYQAIQPAIL